MRQFKWIEWNLQKIAAHALSAGEVEAAFDRVFSLQERRDGSFQMFAETPSGRRIWVIWRYDREDDDEMPDVNAEQGRGLFVVEALADEMTVRRVDDRTYVRVVRRAVLPGRAG